MRIAYNVLYIIPDKVGGTQTYAEGLIKEINKNESDIDFFVFASSDNSKLFLKYKNIKTIVIPINSKNKLLRLLVEQLVLPFYVIFYKIDILHSLGYFCPFFLFKKNVVTIHDLNWYYHPEDFSLFMGYVWRFFVTFSARQSDIIITDSTSSKNSIEQVLKIPSKKIVVAYPGAPEEIKPLNFGRNVFKKLKINTPFVFTVSSMLPHKNLSKLIISFKMISKRIPMLKLVIAGLGGKNKETIINEINKYGLKNKVKILGWVSNDELSALYSNCVVFVNVSLYEGFGFPVLEAFSLGVPVISSDVYSLKEIIENAAIKIDPESTSQIVKAVETLYKNKQLRKKISMMGKKRASFFKWETTIDTLLKAYL
jgi:glycosyltransferase involved in cell wall biosynthesis